LSEDGCGVPVDTPIEVRFDRYLLPKTATRQSLRVFSGTGVGAFLVPTYDVVERVVTYRPSYGSALLPGLLYTVVLPRPDKDQQGYGFRAYDGAPLAPGTVPLRFSFRTARRVPPPAEPPPASDAGCATIDAALEAFARSGCTSSGCHAGNDAVLGLRLDSADGLRTTALSRVAHETDVGATPGQALVDPSRFGVGMPIVDPGSPATSYLLYKLLVNPANFPGEDGGCRSTHRAELPPSGCFGPSLGEQRRLRDWFVAADPMPPDGAGVGGSGGDDLRTIQDFILLGAGTPECW
jgi:hypothetical protein